MDTFVLWRLNLDLIKMGIKRIVDSHVNKHKDRYKEWLGPKYQEMKKKTLKTPDGINKYERAALYEEIERVSLKFKGIKNRIKIEREIKNYLKGFFSGTDNTI